MKKTTGRFFFKLTTNGNLLGEYSNNDCNRSYVEAANKTLKMDNDVPSKFVGDYVTVWFEMATSECISANLKITTKESSENLFRVCWTSTHDNSPDFEGEAMLCDNILVGNYSKRDKISPKRSN